MTTHQTHDGITFAWMHTEDAADVSRLDHELHDDPLSPKEVAKYGCDDHAYFGLLLRHCGRTVAFALVERMETEPPKPLYVWRCGSLFRNRKLLERLIRHLKDRTCPEYAELIVRVPASGVRSQHLLELAGFHATGQYHWGDDYDDVLDMAWRRPV